MSYIIFEPLDANLTLEEAGVFVQGTHNPSSLIVKTGIWIDSAGSALFTQDNFRLSTGDVITWLIVDEGSLTFVANNQEMLLTKGRCVSLPPDTQHCEIRGAENSRLLWVTFAGPLRKDFLARMNSLNLVPARQGVLPTQIMLVRQIVQVLGRHSGTSDASYQLEQLLWGLIAAHSGQSVATQATLSHEISRVVDAMRSCRYRDSFSLANMASISRMPVETFRKRFTSELGIPPLGYLLFLKIERAKHLLRKGLSVRQTGIEVGISDPYHFSKQFKHVVGMSPMAYLKHVNSKEDYLLFSNDID